MADAPTENISASSAPSTTPNEQAQTPTQDKPVSFHELNQPEQGEQTADTPLETPSVQPSEAATKQVEQIKVSLDKDVENILSKAGDDMKKSLFKSSNKDTPIDAAE